MEIQMKNNSVLLWLDDMRNPYTENWVWDYAPEFVNQTENVIWVKNYYEFIDWIRTNGVPYMIAFDHDLGEDIAKSKVANGMSKRQARIQKRETKSGMECTKWLVDYLMDNDLDIPKFTIQSANPVGKENINSYLTNYQKSR